MHSLLQVAVGQRHHLSPALLEDEAAAVRVAAVGALGRLGSAESHAEALSELLGDPDRGVRGAVTGALKQWEAA